MRKDRIGFFTWLVIIEVFLDEAREDSLHVEPVDALARVPVDVLRDERPHACGSDEALDVAQ